MPSAIILKAINQCSIPCVITQIQRMIFDVEQLSGLMARTKKDLALMEDLILLSHKLVHGREISGLGAYEK
jgi:type I restriction enzyme, R subunit